MEDSFSSLILLIIDHQLALAGCLSVGQNWHNKKNDVTPTGNRSHRHISRQVRAVLTMA
jgi:hypothetical protein